MGRLRFGTARSPAVTGGGGQRHSFTAHGYRQPGGPLGPPQPASPAASTSSAVPASPPRNAQGLPAPPGLAGEEAMGCQDGGGMSGYPASGCPACVRPPAHRARPTRQSPSRPLCGPDVYAPFHRPDAFDPPTQSPCPPRWCPFISPGFGATIRLRGPTKHVLHTHQTTERLQGSTLAKPTRNTNQTQHTQQPHSPT